MCNRRHQTYDYTEIEDRICLKLDTLKDRLKHLNSSELEQVESGLGVVVKVIELFRRRHRPTSDAAGPSTINEQPDPTDIGHAGRTAAHGQGGGFQGKETTPIPLTRKDS